MNRRLLLVCLFLIVVSSAVGVLSSRNITEYAAPAGGFTSMLGRPTQAPTPNPTLPPPPPQALLEGGEQVFQSFNNCGPASMSMALSHYGVSTTQATIGEVLRPYQHPKGDNDDKSVTLAELAAYAESLGYVSYHRPAGSIEVLQRLVAAGYPVITRTWLELDEDIGHYRVIKGYDQTTDELIQDDSLQGANLAYSYADFLQLWKAFNYEFLVFVPENEAAEVARLLGELSDEQQAWELALAQTEEQVEQNPDDMYAWFNQSVANYNLGDYPAAVATYEQVADKLPRRMLWYQIEPILAYYQLAEHEQVLQMSNAILADENRGFSELYYLQAMIAAKQADIAKEQRLLALAEQYNSGDSWRVNVAGIY